jgi:hypothetical protein
MDGESDTVGVILADGATGGSIGTQVKLNPKNKLVIVY